MMSSFRNAHNFEKRNTTLIGGAGEEGESIGMNTGTRSDSQQNKRKPEKKANTG
jgi:hypothetical protein